MLFSSIRLTEIFEQIENLPINLFNLLSLVAQKTNVPLDDDWKIFRKSNDTALFENILKEYGTNASLQNAFDYLAETESSYCSLLSDYLLQYQAKIQNNETLLNKYGYSLKNSVQDPCFNRVQEQELIKICLKRNYKNNVMLIGQAGVGKTFLIASIAHTLNLDIYYIDISTILSGSKYRGEFEKKFHDVINEALTYKKILFFDEAHTILNTGNSDGGISGADILKPYLMRKDFQIIGSTTTDEADLFIRDKAFARRFNFIYLEELTAENTKRIIKSKHQQVTYWDKDLVDQIFLYLDTTFMSRKYPDKALDFFDFYFSGEEFSAFKIHEMEKVFKLFKIVNNV